MTYPMLAGGEILPETLEFLNLGWWIVHVVGIALVGFVGFTMGKKCAKKSSGAPGQTPGA